MLRRSVYYTYRCIIAKEISLCSLNAIPLILSYYGKDFVLICVMTKTFFCFHPCQYQLLIGPVIEVVDLLIDNYNGIVRNLNFMLMSTSHNSIDINTITMMSFSVPLRTNLVMYFLLVVVLV